VAEKRVGTGSEPGALERGDLGPATGAKNVISITAEIAVESPEAALGFPNLILANEAEFAFADQQATVDNPKTFEAAFEGLTAAISVSKVSFEIEGGDSFARTRIFNKRFLVPNVQVIQPAPFTQSGVDRAMSRWFGRLSKF